ncbi:MAG: hypothetical protein HYX76_15520 [Acidobacteria bacterium]|nr:hypothetical protein [Acidobacteriota bacterium]
MRPGPGAAPRLSVVLATDTYETIRPVLTALERQRFTNQIEPVIVLPATARAGIRRAELTAFAPARVVAVDSILPLAAARAAGVRAASAPIVFIGETHTYAESGWDEALLAAFKERWSAIVPAIGNANPDGAASWAAYLSDYGTWGSHRPAGEMSDPLTYNTAYRRSVLLALGTELADALDAGNEALWPRLRALGYRAAFAPDARILHLNVGTFGSLLDEKFCAGLVIGMRRAAHWPWPRRILYLVASPLIPVVLLARVARGARRSIPPRLPFGTIPAMTLGAVAKTLGEVLGYAGVRLPSIEARLADIEVRKAQYAGRRAS